MERDLLSFNEARAYLLEALDVELGWTFSATQAEYDNNQRLRRRIDTAALNVSCPLRGPEWSAEAELYPLIRRKFTRGPVGYKRFTSAAEAIRFAVEELPPDLLRGAYLEVDEERFDAKGIRQLYESDTYPLGRRA